MTTMQGNYYGNAPYLISPKDGLSKFATVKYTQGCGISNKDKGDFNHACTIASQADVAILVVGIDQSIESEGHDRDTIGFPGVQNDLIEKNQHLCIQSCRSCYVWRST